MHCALIALQLWSAAQITDGADDPRGPATEADYVVLRAAQLECTIGNNKSLGEHRGGYNGVFAMRAPGQEESPFVADYAGLNLEHFFDGRVPERDRSIFMEPRHAAMTTHRVSDTAVELYQPPTSHYGMESWTRFELKEPYYIDFTFRCIPRKDVFEGGFFGVFWASYINAPINKSMYFLGPGASLEKPHWLQLCTQAHDRDSTVRHESDPDAIALPGKNASLFDSLSPLRYSEPFFYGRFRDMALIYIFHPGPNIRFAHSPSGGSSTKAGDDTNPAWDFQMIVPDYAVDQEYCLESRLVYKPWAGRADVLDEVRAYLGSE